MQQSLRTVYWSVESGVMAIAREICLWHSERGFLLINNGCEYPFVVSSNLVSMIQVTLSL